MHWYYEGRGKKMLTQAQNWTHNSTNVQIRLSLYFFFAEKKIKFHPKLSSFEADALFFFL